MKRTKSIWVVCIFLAGLATANATIFSVPLNCAGIYSGPGPSYYQYEFDLDHQFSQINGVSIAWSGQFSASVITSDYRLGLSDVVDTRGMAWLDNLDATAVVKGGATTYPDLYPFDCITFFSLRTNHTWNDLLDGKSKILIEQDYYIFLDWGGYIECGKWYLNDATLYIDAIVPEPATISLLSFGLLLLRKK